MDAETLVMLLEEHMADARQSMGRGAWRELVLELVQTTAEVAPERQALDSWADQVCDVLKGYSYTKNLLQGVRLPGHEHHRGTPVAANCPVTPDTTDDRSADEAALVERIRAVMQKAEALAEA